MDEQLERQKLFKLLGKIAVIILIIVVALWAFFAIAPYYFAAHPTGSQTAAHDKAIVADAAYLTKLNATLLSHTVSAVKVRRTFALTSHDINSLHRYIF